MLPQKHVLIVVLGQEKSGRWRTQSDDAVVKFSVDGSSLQVTESYDGNIAASKRFKLDEI